MNGQIGIRIRLRTCFSELCVLCALCERFRFRFFFLMLLVATNAAAAITPLELWYSSPATDWEREALPIGNGAMGAMVFGGVATDRIQFNEKTLWTGGPGAAAGYHDGVPPASTASRVARIAAQLDDGGQLTPEVVAAALGRKASGYGSYQTFGDLILAFSHANEPVGGYRRELDLNDAVARVTYESNGIHYRREYFASFPDGVIVVRLSADRPGSVSLRVRLATPGNRTVDTTVTAGRITASGELIDNGLKYSTAVQVLTNGGMRSDLPGQVGVVGADSVVLILAAGTNYRQHYPDYRGVDPQVSVQSRLDNAVRTGYPRLRERHEADHHALFDRVAFDIGQGIPAVPTNELLKQHGTGDALADRALEALYFQYGRYLLIASSRAGSLPANLQGVWNQATNAPWNADYHVNINLQMNYWLAETANLAETTAPLFDFVDGLVEPGQRAARRIVGTSGWTLFLNTNIWGFAGVIDWPTAFWQPEAGAWLAQHYYEHYRFSGDDEFLGKRAWPIMKGAAEFWLDALHADDGQLLVSPSYSPEHGPFTAGAAMSQQIVFDLLKNVVSVVPPPGDESFLRKAQQTLTQIDPGLRVGSWGQLQEWRLDLDDRHDEHRHVSQLFALHPGNQIDVRKSPELAEAARVTLNARGDGGTGWSKAWKINFWARLLDGDRAHKLLGEQLRASTLPNLFDTHPPFQIDGNFGATAGVVEMLLQSQHGVIDVLPALPTAWPSGYVRGLRARGDFTVDIRWSGGQAQDLSVHAGRTGIAVVRSTLWQRPHGLIDVATGASVASDNSGDTANFPVEAGHRYRLMDMEN